MIDKVQKALDLVATHSYGDVQNAIERGTAQVWKNELGVVVTEINDYPQRSVLHFWIAAGEKDAVIALSHEAIEWGKTQGCTKATLAGRKGWLRVLADEGWRASKLTLMERDL